MKAQSAGVASVTLTFGTNNLKSHGMVAAMGRIEIQYSSCSDHRCHHTADYNPSIKSQLASTQLTLGPYGVHIWSRPP